MDNYELGLVDSTGRGIDGRPAEWMLSPQTKKTNIKWRKAWELRNSTWTDEMIADEESRLAEEIAAMLALKGLDPILFDASKVNRCKRERVN